MIDGILAEQKIWNASLGGKKLVRDILYKKQRQAWAAIFAFAKLENEDIRLIIIRDKSKRADKARCVIIKIYTLETELYGAVNQANCTKDESKVPTLGPYAYVLSLSLEYYSFDD